MARPLRVEFQGACYHVINRGNFRFPIFQEVRDREIVLEKLVEHAGQYHVRIWSYCIMINHFHCYLQTLEANLGKFMQSFLTSFAVSHNLRHQVPGHVFQGRYKAFLVEDAKEYRDRVTRYIHLNPARTPSMQRKTVAERRRVVREFEWSSYGAIIGLRSCPLWLERSEVLDGFGKEKQKRYATFVEEGLLEDSWEPQEAAAAQTVIGSDRFVDKIRRGWTSLSEKASVLRDRRDETVLASWVELEKVIETVAEQYKCEKKYIVNKGSRFHEARQVLLYLSAKFCRGPKTLTSLGEELGPISISGLTRARQRVEQQIKSDRKLRKKVMELERKIVDKSNSDV